MPRRREGYSLVNLFVVLLLIVLLAALLLPALGKVREMARRSKCGKNVNQIMIAQQNYAVFQNQKGWPEEFVRGTEGVCRPGGKARDDADITTDASRAFIYLAKRNFIDNVAAFACPSDPFLAVLDTPGSNLEKADVDFPAENDLVPKQWAPPASAARTETGHSYYSYSMQAGSSNKQINLTPKILASLPVVSERNPWSEVLPTLTGDNPDANGYANGNSWNHNREGQSIAERDGTTFFIPDARGVAMPESPRIGSAGTFDYLYSDEPLKAARSPDDVFFTGKKYVGVGADQTKRTAESAWGCYMFD